MGTLVADRGAAAELSEDPGCAARLAIPRQHRLAHSLCAEWAAEMAGDCAAEWPWQETFCSAAAAAMRAKQQACSDPRARAGSALVQVASTSVNATEITRRIIRGL